MLGLFGFFGRSKELQRLDQAFRRVDLHPALVPEAVKLTILKQLKEDGPPSDERCDHVAPLLAYCMLGADAFETANDAALRQDVETRINDALNAGDSPDARLVLLTLQAEIIQPEVVEGFGLEMEETQADPS